jgi:F-type H+-transporting ATPase subunit delta
MSDATTIARPYAKAIFKHALDAKLLSEWSTVLYALAQTVLDPDTNNFICNPATTPELQTQLLLAVCSKKSKAGEMLKTVENVIGLLAANKRLLVLPDIFAQYEVLRAEQEKTLTANVSSFAALSSAQQQELINSLSQRLQRKVTLEMSIDESLLGGAVIRAGDLVIDGSVRGKLNKLGTSLAA